MRVKTEDIVNHDLWKIFPVINVDKTKDIPKDYPGLMGVPITFLNQFNPMQFEILGITKGGARLESGREPYRRLLIRHLSPDLPDEIDLIQWLAKCGVSTDVCIDGEPFKEPDGNQAE